MDREMTERKDKEPRNIFNFGWQKKAEIISPPTDYNEKLEIYNRGLLVRYMFLVVWNTITKTKCSTQNQLKILHEILIQPINKYLLSTHQAYSQMGYSVNKISVISNT